MTDITIHWGNRATYNRHQVALDVQDGVNLRALAREFVKVVDTAMEETGDTGKTWDDAAVVLFVNKFESLCRSEARFSTAYAVCQERTEPSLATIPVSASGSAQCPHCRWGFHPSVIQQHIREKHGDAQ